MKIFKPIYYLLLLLAVVSGTARAQMTGTPYSPFVTVTNISPTSGGTSVISITCGTGTNAGSLFVGTPATVANTETLPIIVTTAGTYSITASLHEVTFTGTGSVTTGSTSIILTATGTPNATTSGNTWALSTTPTCSFSYPINGAASSATTATFPNSVTDYVFSVKDVAAGTLATGTTTIIMPYTDGNGGVYPDYTSPDIAIPASNSGAEGGWTYAYSYAGGTLASGSGAITLTLVTKLTSTPTDWPAFQVASVNTVNADISTVPWVFNSSPVSDINVTLGEGGDAIRGALAAVAGSCTSCTAYDAATVNDVVPISKAEYDQIALIAGVTTAGSTTSDLSSVPSSSFQGGNEAQTQTTTATLLPANSYIPAFALNMAKNEGGTGSSSEQLVMNSVTGNAAPTVTTTASNANTVSFHLGNFTDVVVNYFAVKRPTQKSIATGTSMAGIYESNSFTTRGGRGNNFYNNTSTPSIAAGNSWSGTWIAPVISSGTQIQFISTNVLGW